MAPELLNPNILDIPSFRSDVYAFGITCIEVMTSTQSLLNLLPGVPTDLHPTATVP